MEKMCEASNEERNSLQCLCSMHEGPRTEKLEEVNLAMSSVFESIKVISPILDIVVVLGGLLTLVTGHLVEGGVLTAAGLSLIVKGEGK